MEYENTLLKINDILYNHDIKLLIPGHGVVTRDHEEIICRQEESLKYIRELRYSISNKSDEKVDRLIDRYQFGRTMKKCHCDNIAFMKNELGIE